MVRRAFLGSCYVANRHSHAQIGCHQVVAMWWQGMARCGLGWLLGCFQVAAMCFLSCSRWLLGVY